MKRLFEQFEGNKELEGLMENFLQQFMAKDVLYPQLKEMRDKYPEWLSSHKESLSPDDNVRYTRQFQCVQQICTLYEKPEPVDTQRIVQLLGEVRSRLFGCGRFLYR